jgi:uncharacterized paraquat-inducible protein A
VDDAAPETDIRPCPVCNEPIDVTEWSCKEANSCESCGVALFVDFDDTLMTVPWSQVEF